MSLTSIKQLTKQTGIKLNDYSIWPFQGAYMGYRLKDIPYDFLIKFRDSKLHHVGTKKHTLLNKVLKYINNKETVINRKPYNYWVKGRVWVYKDSHLRLVEPDKIPEGYKKGFPVSRPTFRTKETNKKVSEKLKAYNATGQRVVINHFTPENTKLGLLNSIKTNTNKRIKAILKPYIQWFKSDKFICEVCGSTEQVKLININHRNRHLDIQRRTDFNIADLMAMCFNCVPYMHLKNRIKSALWVIHVNYLEDRIPYINKIEGQLDKNKILNILRS